MCLFDRNVITFIYRTQGWNIKTIYTASELWLKIYKSLEELPLECLLSTHQYIPPKYKCQYITVAALRALLDDKAATVSTDGSLWYSVLGTPFLFHNEDHRLKRYESVLRLNRIFGFRDAHLFYENESVAKNEDLKRIYRQQRYFKTYPVPYSELFFTDVFGWFVYQKVLNKIVDPLTYKIYKFVLACVDSNASSRDMIKNAARIQWFVNEEADFKKIKIIVESLSTLWSAREKDLRKTRVILKHGRQIGVLKADRNILNAVFIAYEQTPPVLSSQTDIHTCLFPRITLDRNKVMGDRRMVIDAFVRPIPFQKLDYKHLMQRSFLNLTYTPLSDNIPVIAVVKNIVMHLNVKSKNIEANRLSKIDKPLAKNIIRHKGMAGSFYAKQRKKDDHITINLNLQGSPMRIHSYLCRFGNRYGIKRVDSPPSVSNVCTTVDNVQLAIGNIHTVRTNLLLNDNRKRKLENFPALIDESKTRVTIHREDAMTACLKGDDLRGELSLYYNFISSQELDIQQAIFLRDIENDCQELLTDVFLGILILAYRCYGESLSNIRDWLSGESPVTLMHNRHMIAHANEFTLNPSYNRHWSVKMARNMSSIKSQKYDSLYGPPQVKRRTELLQYRDNFQDIGSCFKQAMAKRRGRFNVLDKLLTSADDVFYSDMSFRILNSFKTSGEQSESMKCLLLKQHLAKVSHNLDERVTKKV